MGRNMPTTTFDAGKALIIIEQLAEGLTLNAICKDKEGMPHPTTFKRWMVNNPELAKAYKVAVEISATSLEEEALDAAREIARAQRDGTHVRAVEVKLNQLRWSAERRDPSKFGTKSQINVRVPVQIITPIDLNIESGPSGKDIYTIQASAVRTLDSIADRAEGKPIADQRLVRPGKGGKQRLMPPSGKYTPSTPFNRVVRGLQDEEDRVRPEGDKFSDGQGDSGVRNEGVHSPSTEEDTHQQEASNPEQAPKVSGGVGL